MEKVLVTGANGFLATNIIHRLLECGYAVRGLLRRESSYAGIKHPALELVEGDFTDSGTIARALEGCDHVVHAAALTSQRPLPYTAYHAVNVAATDALLRESVAKRIKRFVYVSSANTFGFGGKDFPGDETCAPRRPFTDSGYALSKGRAQEIVASYSDRLGVVTVNPTFMIGPYDTKPGSGRIIMMGFGRRVAFHPPGGKNFVHVADAAAGIVAALEHGVTGRQYLLAGENISYRDFYRLMARESGRRTLLVRIPGPLMKFAGAVGTLASKVGIKTDVSLTNMRMLCVGNYYSNARSVRELGLRYRPVAEAVKDAAQWFRDSGMLKR